VNDNAILAFGEWNSGSDWRRARALWALKYIHWSETQLRRLMVRNPLKYSRAVAPISPAGCKASLIRGIFNQTAVWSFFDSKSVQFSSASSRALLYGIPIHVVHRTR
jgi:hypothetical protein